MKKLGSPYYMSPEMLRAETYDSKADVYSFAIVLWELTTCKEPYDGQFSSMPELVESVTKEYARPHIPSDTCVTLKNLLKRCWSDKQEERPSFSEMLYENEFDKIILETTISPFNEKGMEFWKKHYQGQWTVHFSKFVIDFLKEIGLPKSQTEINDDERLLPLKEVLAIEDNKPNTEWISIENFGNMLEWFGPLDKAILERMTDLVEKNWFFGFLSTAASTKYVNKDIKNGKKGVFLIRFSNSFPGNYSVCNIGANGIQHVRISHQAGGKYTYGSVDFDSLDELINSPKLKKNTF